MNEGKLSQQQRALVSLTELLHSPQNVSQGISANMLPHLIRYGQSENLTCRQKAAEALKIVSQHSIGRSAILSDINCIVGMSKSVCSRF